MTIRYMWRENEFIRNFLLRPEMAEPIARIADTKTLRFWFDLTFIHQSSQDGKAGPGTAWHHDCSAFDFKGLKLPSLWMAMTPTDSQRSRLEFIDKSHKSVPGFYRAPAAVYRAEVGNYKPEQSNDGFLECPDYNQLVAEGKEKVISWDCKPGDAIILHPYTIHGAKGNVGNAAHGRRVAITTRWLGDDVRFIPTPYNANVRTPGFAAANMPLGALPKGEYFPLVWGKQA
jgi:ectoine hydroxylase-related dioxygenase (phytanoyl-CoA dioxygenase family)